jgi:hypothetical protein
MYSAFFTGSTAGVAQTGAPDGPYSCVPTAFFFVGCGVSVMV